MCWCISFWNSKSETERVKGLDWSPQQPVMSEIHSASHQPQHWLLNKGELKQNLLSKVCDFSLPIWLWLCSVWFHRVDFQQSCFGLVLDCGPFVIAHSSFSLLYHSKFQCSRVGGVEGARLYVWNEIKVSVGWVSAGVHAYELQKTKQTKKKTSQESLEWE